MDIYLNLTYRILPVLAAGPDPLKKIYDHGIVVTDGGWFIVSNHVILMIFSAILMLIIFPIVARPYRGNDLVPTGTRNFFEAILVFIRSDVVKPILGDQTDRFIGYLWTLFFFILFNNLIGLMPLDVVTLWVLGLGLDYPVYGTPTGNVWVTGALAVIAFLVMQISGIRANGFVNYSKHFLGGAPWYMFPIMIPVELLGMVVKPFALMIRLAANMTAGSIMLGVLLMFVSLAFVGLGTLGGGAISLTVILGSVAIMALKLFVSFLQAYIFTFLTSLFIGQLVVHEHDDEHHVEEIHEGDEPISGGHLEDMHKLPAEARQAGGHMAAG
jgi:F-type H+-transporting ATPase subunit a